MKRLLILVGLLAIASAADTQDTTPTPTPPPALTAYTLLATRYNAPYSIAFSGDGSQIAAVSASTQEADMGMTALQWFANGEAREITRGSEVFYSAAFHPILPQLVATAYSGSVDIFSTPDMALQASVFGHESAAQIAFAPDGSRFVTADWSGLLIWSGITNEVTYIIIDPNALPENTARVAISPDSQFVAWLSFPATVVVNRLDTGEEVARIVTGYDIDPYQIAFTPDNRLALAYGTLEIWDIATGQLVDRVITSEAVRDVAYSRAGTRMVLLTADNVARIIDPATDETLAVANPEGAQAWDVALSADGRRLAVGLDNGIAVYDIP